MTTTVTNIHITGITRADAMTAGKEIAITTQDLYSRSIAHTPNRRAVRMPRYARDNYHRLGSGHNFATGMIRATARLNSKFINPSHPGSGHKFATEISPDSGLISPSRPAGGGKADGHSSIAAPQGNMN